jgi:hypothetical protein
MHGVIFLELKKYVETKLGAEAWTSLLDRAGLAGREFTLLQEYPDAEVVALVTHASEVTGLPAADILEDFGAFIAPDLLEMFWGTLQPSWKTLDVIEHTEESIHSVVRLRNPGARPPELRVTRPSATQVEVHYSSPRRMCAVARGIVRGMAAHFGDTVSIAEPQCMHRGDAACIISVELVSERVEQAASAALTGSLAP